jgi:GntR family phosphonate transport system transcriptional regulator
MSVYLVTRGEGGIPVYRQIRDVLINEIRDIYKPGDILPSENEMADRFGVNRHTLRRAVDELVLDGIVGRYHGKGVFVLEPAITYTIDSATRFTETIESLGHTTESRVLRKQILPVTRNVASKLQIPEHEKVIYIETLREVEGKPFCVISHYLKASKYQAIMDNYDRGSLHTFLKNKYEIELKRTESHVSAVLPEASDASLLNMPRQLPILLVKSINLDIQTNKPIEYAKTRFRGDATQLSFQP